MKKVINLLLLLVIFSCSNDDTPPFTEESDLIGSWVLIEQFSDPGDGSGEFFPVQSQKTITFFEDGTFQINGSLFLDTDTGPLINGIYVISNEDLTMINSDNFLAADVFQDQQLPPLFFFEENTLVIAYACIEGCSERFRKI